MGQFFILKLPFLRTNHMKTLCSRNVMDVTVPLSEINRSTHLLKKHYPTNSGIEGKIEFF